MKLLLVDAICGIGFPSMQLALQAEMTGMARDGEWMRDRLMVCREDQLQALYQGLREAREEAALETQPEQSVIIHAN